MSLVEVSVALGLVSFALVSVVGILPVGLIAIREARESSLRGNMVMQIESEYAVTSFAVQDERKTFYFDGEGRVVGESSPDRLYRVEATTLPPSFPGMSGVLVDSLKRLQISVGRLSGAPDFAPVGPTSRFAVKVSNSGI